MHARFLKAFNMIHVKCIDLKFENGQIKLYTKIDLIALLNRFMSYKLGHLYPLVKTMN